MNQEQNPTLFVDQASLEVAVQPLIQSKIPYLTMWENIDDILNCKDSNANETCSDREDAVPIK